MKIKTKFINLCKKFAHNFSILILIFLFLFASLILSIPVSGILVCRLIVSKCATACSHRGERKLTKILTSGATMFATDNVFTGKPNLNVVTIASLQGSRSVQLKELRELVRDKVLDLRDEQGKICYPEFKQYYYPFWGFLFFTPEKDFNIENHIRLYDYGDLDLEGVSSKSICMDDLCRVKPELLTRGWPEGRSPWEFLLIPNFRGEEEENSGAEGTALVFRFHHGIGDGLTFFDILWNCLANGEQRNAKDRRPFPTSPRRPLSYYLTLPFRLHFDYIKQLVESNDENPWKLSELQLSSTGVESAITKKISLNIIKGIRHQFNVSFSSILVAAISGALRRTMIEQNIQVPPSMHALLPIPRRVGRNTKLRNYLSILYAKLPTGTKDCGRRILEADEDLKRLKKSTLPLSNGLCHQIAGSLTSPLVRFLQKNVFATVLLSSLPMPTTACHVFGNEMKDISFSTSCHGNNGIRISIMSYNYNLRMSVEVNKALPRSCPSVNLAQQIVTNIEAELKNMKNLDTIKVV